MTINKPTTAACLPDEKEHLERLIAATDRQIDALVYELYGLTPEKIKIVEGSTHQTFLAALGDRQLPTYR